MAARLERSRGWIMKQALSAWIAQEEERDRLTQEALADVDAGLVETISRCRPGPTAWAPTSRCRCHADGAEVDPQGACGSDAPA